MDNIFKFNLEPNINYENIDFNQIKEKLKNLRLNISEEIKCITFIKEKLKIENINTDENCEINEALMKKYCLILNKLNELCLEEINYISEIIIILDEKIKQKNNITNFASNEDDIIYDKIDLTKNNYNKIIDNINKTISSLPYIFNIYLEYIKIEEEENKFIRDNIEKEEKNYKKEKNEFNNIKKLNKIKYEEEKEITKREKMKKFNEGLKSLKTKKNIKVKNKDINDENLNNKTNFEINTDNLKKEIKELNSKKEELKNYIYKYCIKENEIKNFNKIKEDNKILNEEIFKLKNIISELNNRYKYQNEKLEKLKTERTTLENENSKLIEYINKILADRIINTDTKILYENNNSEININPINFESIEMFKRLNKL